MIRNVASLRNDSRGFTETIGFFLLFSVLIASIIMLYTHGVGSLLEIQYGSQASAGQQVMIAIAEDVSELYQGEKSKESINMQLSAVSFGTVNSQRMEITINDTSTTTSKEFEYWSKALIYRQESKFAFRVPSTRFYYTFGALFRTDGDNSVMIQQPPFHFSPDRTYLTGLELRGTAGAGGNAHAVTTFTERDTRIDHYDESANRDIRVTIHIETTPARAKAWQTYFEAKGLTETARTDIESGVVEYQYMTRSIVYKKSVVDVEVKS